MAYDVKEMWSQRDTTLAVDGWSAAEYYSVTATTIDEMRDDARVARATGIPQPGQSHRSNRDLRVVAVSVGPGLTERIATVRYQIAPAGASGTTDPTQRNPRVSIERAVRSETTVFDVRGNLITNAANDPVENIVVERWSRIIRVTRWERGWNTSQADAMEDAVNIMEMVIGGRRFARGTVRFIASNPVGEFDVDSSVIPIMYELEVRGIGRDSVLGNGIPNLSEDAKKIIANPFLLWVPNLGMRALTRGGQPADIYYKASVAGAPAEKVTAPIALTVSGAVANTSTFMISRNGLAEEPAGARSGRAPWVESATIGAVTYLGYQLHPYADLRKLAL